MNDDAPGDVGGPDDLSEDDDYELSEPGFDWIVFVVRISALVTFGATIATSFDLSLNQGADWLTVMRFAILPFVGGMLLLAAAEVIDRRGD